MSESMSLVTVQRRTDDELTALAERVSKSTLLPKQMQGKMADVLVTIMAGQEMGLAPMASLRAFHVIEGKPVMSADGMVALVLGSGKAVYFDCVEESDKSVTYETLRAGSKVPQRCTWTWEMAKRAALHQKDNWVCYPRQMLASRAKSELARRVYPDVLMGCYSDDEIQHSDARQSPPRTVASQPDAIDAEYVDVQPTPQPPIDLDDYPEIAELAMAMSIAELKPIADRFAARKLGPGPAYDAMGAAYKARLQALKALAAEAKEWEHSKQPEQRVTSASPPRSEPAA